MKIFYLLMIVVIVTFFYCGCSSAPVKDVNQRPIFISNPTASGQYKYGGVGIARRHVKGIREQRKMAIASAINEIAAQLGVEVENKLELVGSGTKDSYSIRMKESSTHTSKNYVEAKVKEFWTDTYSGEIYVWMVVK